MENQETITSQKTITWKAEIEFVGKLEEFEKFTKALSIAQVRIVGKWGKLNIPDKWNAGYISPVLLDTVHINRILNESNVQRTADLINGGIRTPHFHIGKEIFLVDREKFKSILGEVARDVFENRALQSEDYMDAITPLVEIER